MTPEPTTLAMPARSSRGTSAPMPQRDIGIFASRLQDAYGWWVRIRPVVWLSAFAAVGTAFAPAWRWNRVGLLAFGGLAVPIAAVAISAAAVPRYVVPYEVVGFLSTAWLVQLWMVHRFDARSVESVAVGDTTDAPRERSPVVPRATDPGQSAADRNP